MPGQLEVWARKRPLAAQSPRSRTLPHTLSAQKEAKIREIVRLAKEAKDRLQSFEHDLDEVYDDGDVEDDQFGDGDLDQLGDDDDDLDDDHQYDDPTTPPKPDLVIYSVNLKQSSKRLQGLMDMIDSPIRKEPAPDIVAIQDPPPQLYTVGHWQKNYDVHVFYDHFPLKEHLTNLKYDDLVESFGFARVAFLVKRSIEKRKCIVKSYLDTNVENELIRTLEIQTSSGPLLIHNIYNHKTRLATVPFELLNNKDKDNCIQVLVGDLNCHGPSWIQEDEQEDQLGRIWAQDLERFDMISKLKPGEKTFSRTNESENTCCSTIDCIFVHKSLDKCVAKCDIIQSSDFQSDHRILGLTLDMTVASTKPSRRFLPAHLRDDFQKLLRESLLQMDHPSLTNVTALEAYANELCTSVVTAADAMMPWTNAPKDPERGPMGEALSLLTEMATRAMEGQEHSNWITHYNDNADLLRRETILEFKKAKRERIREETKADPHAVFRHDRLAARRSTCPTAPQMPCLVREDGTLTTTHDEAATLLVKTHWPGSMPVTADGGRQILLAPDYSTYEEMEDVPDDLQVLRPGEVSRIIRNLKPKSAPGPSRITAQMLQWGRDSLVKPIEHLFRACLNLKTHPKCFQDSITKMIPKLKKDTAKPESYRPVDLCCNLGKILDRVISSRYADLVAIKHDLLPQSQYGKRGKDTTMAIQHITNWVYSAWLKKWRTTILSLDIKGAYNHVDRNKLIETLIKNGIPKWLIEITLSSLSNRVTTVDMAGVRSSEKYIVEVGVPQGSPLSSILFLLFAAPVLIELEGKDILAVLLTVFAYVDDFYLMVSSSTYKQNCAALEKIHLMLMELAVDRGIKFSPQKYKLMHFRVPGAREPICTELPQIPEMLESDPQGKDILITPALPKKNKWKLDNDQHKHAMCILGIWVDPQLKWAEQISQVRQDVFLAKLHLPGYCGSTYGPEVHKMLVLYERKLLKKIMYGCAAWFNFSLDLECKLKYSLSQDRLKRLEAIQRDCLKSNITGAGSFNIAYEQLMNEFTRSPLKVVLFTEALLQRMGQYWKANGTEIPVFEARRLVRDEEFQLSDSQSSDHPLVKQELEATNTLQNLRRYPKLSWIPNFENGTEIAEWRSTLRKVVTAGFEHFSVKGWDTYRDKQKKKVQEKTLKHPSPCLDTEWGAQNLARYKDLSKAESTFLLLWRTEKLPLNAYLYPMYANARAHQKKDPSFQSTNGMPIIQSPQCPLCKREKHHAKHLFLHCKALESERSMLRQELGSLDYTVMLSDKKCIKTAVQWGILNFDIAMFAAAKEEIIMARRNASVKPTASRVTYHVAPHSAAPDSAQRHSRPHKPRRTRQGRPRQSLT